MSDMQTNTVMLENPQLSQHALTAEQLGDGSRGAAVVDRRQDARVLLAVHHAAVDAYEQQMIEYVRKSCERVRHQMAPIEAWADGGDVPAAATRFAELHHAAMEHCCTCAGKNSCTTCEAGRALQVEFNSPVFVESVWTALGWVTGHNNDSLETALEALEEDASSAHCTFAASADDRVLDAMEHALATAKSPAM